MSTKRKNKGLPGAAKRPPSPRQAAFECIEAVVYDSAYANLAMPRILANAGLTGRDAAFATELAYGALRMEKLYDAVIASAARRPAEAVDNSVRIALWLGIHQALAMRVPPHAAVNETVEQARRHAGVGAAKFTNAVMRRVTERDADAWLAVVASGTSREALATRHSHPEWVVAELEQALTADGRSGEIEQLLAADNDPAAVTLVARPGLQDRDELAAAIEDSQATSLSPYGVTLAGGAPGDIDAVRERRAAVQDEGSQVAAAVLVSSRPVAAGERWLDMCAGPGGKAALLGALAAQSDATLDALELHEHRADLVRDSVRAVPDGVVSVHVGDGRTWDGGAYDRILLDAPCTGLGALRRRPEARWRREQEDVAELATLQRELLDAATRLLKPGGTLAYVTCSPVVAETTAVLEGSSLAALDTPAALAELSGADARTFGTQRHAQLWPHVHGTDAMFIALLEAPQ